MQRPAPDTILATSSSGLSISDIQTGLSGAGRCIAAHPYNPPHLIPIVELAPGSQTDPAVMARARDFYLSVGKDPVVLSRDCLLYTSDAADDLLCVDLGGRRIIKKKKKKTQHAL